MSSRDFCVWVVPPHDGRVRKIRFSFRALAILLCFFSATAAMVVLITGDYTKAQLARARNYVFLKQISEERNHLRSKSMLLESQVKEFETSQSETTTYEDKIKRRLKELASVIDSATSLGLGENKKSRDKSRGGVGGAEIDCSGRGGASRCSDLIDEATYIGEDPLASLNDAGEEDLIKMLDAYISVVRTLPIGYPASGDVTSGFGFRVSPFGRRIKMHEGVDLALKYGSYVFATGDGVIKSIRKNATYGLMIDVGHGDRLSTRYAHLSRILVKEGQRVKRGTVIGLAGSSGRSTGPHLHYEVLVDGRPKNPSRFIDLAKRIDRIF